MSKTVLRKEEHSRKRGKPSLCFYKGLEAGEAMIQDDL